jgi:type VI protein secretion system component Hcp
MSDDLFLKFDGVQGEAEDGRVHRDFDVLGHQFGELGDDFLKLIDDASSTHGEALHKVADDALINHIC